MANDNEFGLDAEAETLAVMPVLFYSFLPVLSGYLVVQNKQVSSFSCKWVLKCDKILTSKK